MTDSWVIRLGGPTPPLTSNMRFKHWAQEAKIKAAIRRFVATHARYRIPPCESIHVQLVYVPRDRRRRDPHNLFPTIKCAIDGLVDAGVIADDTPEYLSESMPVIAEPDPKDPHLRLEITRGKR